MMLAKYILIGLVWTIFLEWITTNETYIDSAPIKWTNRERTVQVLIWPFGMLVFIGEFLKNLWK